MSQPKQASPFYADYDLAERRWEAKKREPAPHQKEALDKIHKWYRRKEKAPHGGFLVLPTGGGKTFTAVYFACRSPLSDGYKVLWLAHTHHLLEQAFRSFKELAGLIAEPKRRLAVRVVSGTIGHFPVHRIRPEDDVVIASLPSMVNAHKNNHPQWNAFLKAAGSRVLVIFDEAHHSPAPSYRALVTALRTLCPQLFLLGLTATPIYTDERKQGWLTKLFPQNFLYQVDPKTLMSEGILA